MARRATPEPAPPGGVPEVEPGVAVSGEMVTLDAVVPDAATLKADRSNRKARTAAQAFPAAALVGLIVYVLMTFVGLDMNVDPDETLPPPEQVLGAGALVTWGIAAWMNREPKDEK